MYKYLSLAIILLTIACSIPKEKQPVNIIPQPNHVVVEKGMLKLSSNLSIGVNSDELRPVVQQFTKDFNGQLSLNLTEFAQARIKVVIENPEETDEGYVLQTTREGITIHARSETGIFYALQSLKQLLLFAEKDKETTKLPLVKINDTPRFSWRGLMLDESRHFFGIDKVKQLLDLMAMHKLNVFHWHLTDVPGWRIEIKQYPKLTTVGGIGNDTNPDAEAKFYTQDEIREIVKYATERHIEIIPEIDMPGHARAANRAYPEFSGGGSKAHPEFTFNPGYEDTYRFLTNILREVAELFPSKYIHLGGDEVHYGNHAWKTNAHVKDLMQKHHLNNLKEVEAYFVNRMADSIQALGKTVIGWDEIVDLNLPRENSLVMWWRHDKPKVLKNALAKNYRVVLCPRIPLYFDFDQDAAHQYGRKWGGAFSPLEMIHAFPPDTLSGFNEYNNQVNGLQANIWTERIQNEERLDYMTYPRISALAEAGWTKNEMKNLEDFKRRLKPMLRYLDTKEINYFNPFDPAQNPEPVGLYRK